MNFVELRESYFDSLRRKPSWRNTINISRAWVSTLTDAPTRRDILARQEAVCDGNYRAGAAKANKELGILRAMFNWGTYRECWSGGNPTQGIRRIRTAGRERIATQPELARLRTALDAPLPAHDQQYAVLLMVLLVTGCRPSEGRMMRWDHLRPSSDGMMRWQKGTTKNGRPQELPLPRQVVERLLALPRQGAYCFTAYGPHPLSDTAVRSVWDALCASQQVHGLWLYDLRRTACTMLVQACGVDILTAKAVLNHHEGSVMGQHYFRPTWEHLSAVMQRYADWLWSLGDGHASDTPLRTLATTAPAWSAATPPLQRTA